MSFEWAYQGMTQLDAQYLATGLAANSTLETLVLRKCEISDATAQIIFSAFSETSAIHTIGPSLTFSIFRFSKYRYAETLKE